MLIPLNQIAVLKRQRKELDNAKVEELATSIELSGLLHPIVVRRARSGVDDTDLPYVLVVGGRRMAAHLFLDREEIEARLFEELDPFDAEVAELEENLKRVNLTWQEESDARARIHELLQTRGDGQVLKGGSSAVAGQTLAATAEELGISVAQLSRDLELHRAMQEDPTLRSATTKNAARRQAAFRANIAAKSASVEADKASSVRERLHICDAVAYAQSFPDKSIDLIFTDLPYAIEQFEVQSTGQNHDGQSGFDDSRETVLPFIERLVPELVRTVKPRGWIILFMSYEWHMWLMHQIDAANEKQERKLTVAMPSWIWHRPESSNWGHFPEYNAANRYEPIVVVRGEEARLIKKPVENVLTFPAVANADKLHNHQKPHELCRELVDRCTVPGELVVDFCFGSGAHLAAAASMGRSFAGSENNPKNLDVAIAHIAQFYTPPLKLEK